MMKITGKYGTW